MFSLASLLTSLKAMQRTKDRWIISFPEEAKTLPPHTPTCSSCSYKDLGTD
jgi:hypothetical protein